MEMSDVAYVYSPPVVIALDTHWIGWISDQPGHSGEGKNSMTLVPAKNWDTIPWLPGLWYIYFNTIYLLETLEFETEEKGPYILQSEVEKAI
jgi:hypothetical protein